MAYAEAGQDGSGGLPRLCQGGVQRTNVAVVPDDDGTNGASQNRVRQDLFLDADSYGGGKRERGSLRAVCWSLAGRPRGAGCKPDRALSHFPHPGLLTERAPTLDTRSHGRDFFLAERLIDPLEPIRRPSGRPRREEFWLGFRFLSPTPQRTVLPVFRLRSHTRTERISLHVTTDDQEMSIVGDGKILEASLVQVPLSRSVIMRMVTLRVRRRDPPQHSPHLSDLGGPQDQVPMVGHQRERKQFHGVAIQPFSQHAQERLIILGLVKDRLSSIPAIQSVVDRTGFISTFLSGHGIFPINAWRLQVIRHSTQAVPPQKTPSPFRRDHIQDARSEGKFGKAEVGDLSTNALPSPGMQSESRSLGVVGRRTSLFRAKVYDWPLN